VRVLHLSTTFPRAEGDTAGLFLLDGTACLAAHGMEAHVLAPHDAGARTAEVIDGVDVRRFRYAPDRAELLAYRGGMLANVRRPERAALLPLFVAAYVRAALATARRVRPDVVHAHWWFPSGVVGAVVARRLGVPLVVTLHGSDVHIAARPGLDRLARWVFGRAAVVAAVSDALRDEVVASFHLDSGTVPVLPMPLRIEAAGPWSPPSPPPLRLAAVGRLVPEKGFDVLLDALLRLDARGIETSLDVLGDGPGRDALVARAAPLGGRVRFLGARTRDEIAATLAGVHALVVPSRREGLGMVVLEALAVGCPVVVSRTGGLVDVVEEGVDGLFVPVGDAGALADTLTRLPLPAPRGAAVARHLPANMAAAHRAAYEMATAGPARR
jgi:glycosyltransferase involved in cell wall biosynthesis